MDKELNRNIVITIIGKLSFFIIQFFTIVLYARVFTPSEFGVVASISVFVIFFQLLTDIGIEPALINQKRISENEKNGVFTITLLLGIFISFVFFISSRFIIGFYTPDKPHLYKTIFYYVLPTILFSCISIVPQASLSRDLRFKLLAFSEVGSTVVTFPIVIFMSHIVEPVYALAARTSLYAIFRFICLFSMSNYSSIGVPRFGTDFSILKKIKRFSINQFGFSCINYFARNLDNLLIAKYIGAIQLGFYNQAYQIMRYPLMLTSFALSSAIQPVLTKKNKNLNFIANEHNKLVQKLFLVSIIIFLYILFYPEIIVHVILGPQWIQATPVLSILNYSIPLQMIIAISGAFLMAIDRPDLMFKIGATGGLIFICFISLSIYFHSIKATSISVVISFVIQTVVIYVWLFKTGFKASLLPLLSSLLFIIKNMLSYVVSFSIISLIFKIFIFRNYYINFFLSLLILFLCILIFRKRIIAILTEKNIFNSYEISE